MTQSATWKEANGHRSTGHVAIPSTAGSSHPTRTRCGIASRRTAERRGCAGSRASRSDMITASGLGSSSRTRHASSKVHVGPTIVAPSDTSPEITYPRRNASSSAINIRTDMLHLPSRRTCPSPRASIHLGIEPPTPAVRWLMPAGQRACLRPPDGLQGLPGCCPLRPDLCPPAGTCGGMSPAPVRQSGPCCNIGRLPGGPRR